MKVEEIENIIRQTLSEKDTTDKVVSSGNAEVDRVAYYLEQINNREEMILAIPLMFKKIMAYPEHSVTTEEFKKTLYESFGDDDANVLFSVLSRIDAMDAEEEDSEEKPQDEKDREDERLADKDRRASHRRDTGKKYSQSLAGRRHESDATKQESYNRVVPKKDNHIFIRQVFERYK